MALDAQGTARQLRAAQKGKGKASTTCLQPKSLLSLPPELILHIFHLAAYSFNSPFARQQQQFTHDRISKLCYSLGRIHRNSYVAHGEKMVKRLQITLMAKTERATQVEADCREERNVPLFQVGLLLAAGPRLTSLALCLRESAVRAAVSEMLWTTMFTLTSRKLDSFGLRLGTDQSSLELAHINPIVLWSSSTLEKLSLPLITLPQYFAFPFRPSLTSLAVHLAAAGSLDLLKHLCTTSTDTLRHLRLTIHNTFDLLAKLESTLVAIAPSLRSLALWTAVPQVDEDTDPREGKQHTSIFLANVYPLLNKLTHLARAGELVSAPPPILLPSLRQLDFLCGPFNTYEIALKEWLSAMCSDPARRVPFVRLLGRGLTEFAEWIRGDLKELAREARVALWCEEDN